MVDIASIQAAAGSLKAASDIISGLLKLKIGTEVQGKVVELQREILAAQSSAMAAQTDQFSLLERVRQLEKQIAEIEAWESEKTRYQLTDFGRGAFAYQLKEEESSGEPLHRICASCYQTGHKSILQFQHGMGDEREKYECPACKNVFVFGTDAPLGPRRQHW